MRLQTGVLLAGFTVCMVTASGCSDSSADKTTTTAPRSASASSTLIGYGATPAAWDAHHDADSRFGNSDRESVYIDDYFDDKKRSGLRTTRYTDFWKAPDGRILTYAMTFPPKTSLMTAWREVLKEFPADARAGKLLVPTKGDYPGTCAGFTVRSKTLLKKMSRPEDATVGVEFQSGHFDHLDTTDIWHAAIHWGAFTEC